MASWIVHLRVAEKLLNKIPNLSDVEFIFGNIAPDSGVPNSDWSSFTPDTTVSHFKVKNENGKSIICLDKYKEKYFTDEKCNAYNKEQFSFYFGYITHLITDILWVEKIVNPLKIKDCNEYQKDPSGTIWKWKKDWYDLDFLYLRENSKFHAFNVFESAENFDNIYMEEFSPDAFENRRKHITNYYREKRDGLDRIYPYLTKEQMDTFVDEAAEHIYTYGLF